ncbi:MAG: hypothetical protein HY517_03405 [Candidatus Aenigmarchaeota archaeon]|nr:hypothetical protein [Candidatus Aenigmarchaeota archaeon]
MDIKKLLELAKIKPNPALDQYFLTSDEILDKEVELAELKKNDTVLEVGAGIGNLTIRLAKKCRVVAIEKDYSFMNVLKGIGCQAVFSDALEFLESLRSKEDSKAPFNKVVSNIPYSISQPLVLELFRHKWDVAVLIVQKEFAGKLVSTGRLGMVMKDMADVKIVRQIPASAFYPTAVPSSLLLIRQKKQLDDGFWNFLCLLKKNRNVSNQIAHSGKLGPKKVHQLTLAELKELFKLNQQV